MKVYSKTWAEFFAGIGLIGQGLKKQNWSVLWANDICQDKIETFLLNHAGGPLLTVTADIRSLQGRAIPSVFGASSSFPCTNTSAAGNRKGLSGESSSLVYASLERMAEMAETGKQVPLQFFENPMGLVARNKGQDLAELIAAINQSGYLCHLCQVDAQHFLPQSRPRLFIVAVHKEIAGQTMLSRSRDEKEFDYQIRRNSDLYPAQLIQFFEKFQNLDIGLPSHHLALPKRDRQLPELLECLPADHPAWLSSAEKKEMISNLLGHQVKRFRQLVDSPSRSISVINRRGRKNPETGRTMNATEINVSGLATCVRPLGGGSSRQWILYAGQGTFEIRPLLAREAARLMGIPDSFSLPGSNAKAFKAVGDAVVVPAIEWIDKSILTPIYAAYRENLGATKRKPSAQPCLFAA